jgi:hypothetical protein
VCVCVHENVVCVFVCARMLCVCVCAHEIGVCVCVRERETEKESVCTCKSEYIWGTPHMYYLIYVHTCVESMCVFVCVLLL